jgi:hypothetical protein
LNKEIESDIKRWEDLPCSWTGRINIVKVAVLQKAIFRVSAISIKAPVSFFTEIEKPILKFIKKYKQP